MKRVETADYSEFLIRAKFIIRNLEKTANENNFDVAKYMANELKITAMLLNDAFDREILKKSKD
jgi:hypothetical protein